MWCGNPCGGSAAWCWGTPALGLRLHTTHLPALHFASPVALPWPLPCLPAVLVPTCQLSQIRHGPTGTGSASRLLSLPLKDFGVCLPLFCRPPFSSHLAFSPSGH